MQKWDYKTITVKRNIKVEILTNYSVTPWQPTLNLQQLGEEGWELVSVVPISDSSGSGFTHQLQYVFKRQKE